MPNNGTVDIDLVRRSQDVDAAIYLLGRMLGTHKPGMEAEREVMELIICRLRKTGELDAVDREKITELYQEFVA